MSLVLKNPSPSPDGIPNDKKIKSNLLQKLRKERSAKAARDRRTKENVEYDKVKDLLPIDAGIAKNLDKASVIRITISFLRMCKFCENGPKDWNLPFQPLLKGPDSPEAIQKRQNIAMNALKGLDGFLLVISTDGKILYISETVNDHLGLTWDELPGSSFTDVVPHPEDQQELKSILRQVNAKDANREGLDHINCILRFKSQREKRTGNGNKNKNSIPTKACQVVGHLRYSENECARGLVCAVVPLMLLNVRETQLPASSFFVLTDIKFVVTKCDPRVSDFIDLQQDDLLEVSLYSMIHPGDIDNVLDAHHQLLEKQQSTTLYYRWLQRSKGYIWCKSSLSLTQRKGEPENETVLWVNQVISRASSDGNNGVDLFQLFPTDLKVRKSQSANLGLEGFKPYPKLGSDSTLIFQSEAAAQMELKYPGHHNDPSLLTTGGAVPTALGNASVIRASQAAPGPSNQPIGSPGGLAYTPNEEKFTEYTPGSSPEPEPEHKPDPEALNIIQSPNGTLRTEARGELDEDLGNFHKPKNICVSTAFPISQRDQIQNIAKIKYHDSPGKRPRSVVVRPTCLKNEPIAIRNYFKPNHINGEAPSDKYRRTDASSLKCSLKKSRNERNLKKSLDEPGPHNETFRKSEFEDARPAYDSTPKIRLPKPIINDNAIQQTEPLYQNVVVHPEVYQAGDGGNHMPQAVAYVTAGQQTTNQTPQGMIHLGTHRESTPTRGELTVPIPYTQAAPQAPQPNKQIIHWVACHKVVESPDKVDYVKIPDMPVHVQMPGSTKLVPESSVHENQPKIPQTITPHSPKFVSVGGSPINDQAQTVIPLFLPSTSTTGNGQSFGVVGASYSGQSLSGQPVPNQIFPQGIPTLVIPANQNHQHQQQPQVVALVAQGAPLYHLQHQLGGQVQSGGTFINA